MRICQTIALAISFALWVTCTQVNAPRVFSDVRSVEETEDIVGTELALLVDDESVVGTLRHFEGREAEDIAVSGTLRGDHLLLTGTYSEGAVEIDARMAEGMIIGELRFKLPRQTNTVHLRLQTRAAYR